MAVRIIRSPLPKSELAAIAERQFGDLVKAVVDVGRGVLAVGGELHADMEAALLEDGSAQEDLWGINLYPGKSGGEWVEFDSIINLRPLGGNPTRGVEDPSIRQQIQGIVAKLIT